MNRNELEQWMKDRLDEQPFAPSEDGWGKLQAALSSPPPAKDSRKAILSLPVWAKVAASVSFLIAAGTAGYLGLRKTVTDQPVAISAPSIPSKNIPLQPVPAQTSVVKIPVADPSIPVAAATKSATSQTPPVQASHQNIQPAATPEEPLAQQPVVVVTPDAPSPQTPLPEQPRKKNNTSYPAYPDYPAYDGQERARERINLGVAAGVGRVTVGNMQYQLGIVGRKKIADKLYAEATVSVASTNVSYTQDRNFTGVTNADQGHGLQATKQLVVSKYARNVISMGISPAVSYKILPVVALSIGGSVYYNLNQSLELENSGDIAQEAFSNNLINTTAPISKWDAGITGGADCRVTRRLSVNAQYRHGLSNYLYQDNKPVKNSGLNVGLKFLFGL